jgi:hypothetical protein
MERVTMLEYIDESGVLKTEAAIREFIRYMNDPHDITPEGAALLAKARASKITNFDRFTIE